MALEAGTLKDLEHMMSSLLNRKPHIHDRNSSHKARSKAQVDFISYSRKSCTCIFLVKKLGGKKQLHSIKLHDLKSKNLKTSFCLYNIFQRLRNIAFIPDSGKKVKTENN